jgi:hypothetical protein
MRVDRFIILMFMAAGLVAFVAQFIIDFSPDNIAASCIVLASSLVMLLYIFWTGAIQTHPLSTFAIFGFCVTSQLGALLAQSGSGISLTMNLRQPMETFTWLAVFQLTALSSHAIYRVFLQVDGIKESGVLRTWLTRSELYKAPSIGTLWLMAPIGLIGQVMAGSSGVAGKLGIGMSFLAWTPFLIPMFVADIGPSYCNRKRNYIFLSMYVSFIFLLGVASNGRGGMLSGLMTITLVFLLRAMRSFQLIKATHIAKAILLGAIGLAMAVPLTDLTVAMVIARKARGSVSAIKMVEDTLYYATQPDQLEAERARGNALVKLSSYDETYFGNPLLARLMETKFHDNALYFGSHLTARDTDKLWDITDDFIWSTLPDPALKAIKMDVDKENLRFSMGDYLAYLGGAGGLGGFKTGSGFGQGIAMFGLFFPLIYFCLCPILFWTLDILSYRTTDGRLLISALGMLGIWRLFQYGITGESLQYLFMVVVRGLPQSILFYLLAVLIARAGATVLGRLIGAQGASSHSPNELAH